MPLRSWAAQRTERWCCSRGTCDCWTRTGTGWLKKKPNRYKYINTNTTNQVFGQGFTVRSTVYNTSLVQISRGFFFCQSNFWDISLTFSHSITSWHFFYQGFCHSNNQALAAVLNVNRLYYNTCNYND